MNTREENWVLLPYRSVWQHKHRPITAVVNNIIGDDVQIETHARTHLKWLTIRGFLRDYTNTGELEPVELANPVAVS